MKFRFVPLAATALAAATLSAAPVRAGDFAEPNNTCATAYLLGPGGHAGLSSWDWYEPPSIDATDFDHYRIALAPGQSLLFTCTRTGSSGPAATLYGSVYDVTAGCAGAPQLSAFLDNASFAATNSSTASVEYDVVVYAWLANEGYATINYTLNVDIAPIGCAGVDDLLGPSSFSAPRRLTPVTIGGLSAGATDLFAGPGQWDDVYAVRVPPGATIDARIALVHANGDLDLLLADPGSGTVLALSATTADQEQVIRTNTSGVVEEVLVAVRARPADTSICNAYQLDLDVNDPAIGTSYCIAAPNSTENGASLRGFGTSSLGDPLSSLAFAVEGLPPGVPCLLYYGTSTAQVPFGDGFRCVAGSTFREAVVFASAVGEALIPFTPASSQPSGTVVPGSTWHFQAYYRNLTGPLGTGFNLSDGYTILFQP